MKASSERKGDSDGAGSEAAGLLACLPEQERAQQDEQEGPGPAPAQDVEEEEEAARAQKGDPDGPLAVLEGLADLDEADADEEQRPEAAQALEVEETRLAEGQDEAQGDQAEPEGEAPSGRDRRRSAHRTEPPFSPPAAARESARAALHLPEGLGHQEESAQDEQDRPGLPEGPVDELQPLELEEDAGAGDGQPDQLISAVLGRQQGREARAHEEERPVEGPEASALLPKTPGSAFPARAAHGGRRSRAPRASSRTWWRAPCQ